MRREARRRLASRSLRVALVALAVLAAACTPDSSPTSTTEPATSSTALSTPSTSLADVTTTTAPPERPTRGGSLILGVVEEPTSLNPLVPGTGSAGLRLIGNAVHRGVQRINAGTLDYEPDLVSELPTEANGGLVVAEDGSMTVTYEIRPDATWSDGTPVSGDDFAFTLDLILDPRVPVSKAVYEDIIGREASAKQFTFTLATATPRHAGLFSVVVPKHAVEGTDIVTDWNDTPWPSNGPFVVADWQPGVSMRLERNDRWVGFRSDGSAPYLDAIEVRFFPDAAATVDAFRLREVDVIQPGFDLDLYEALASLTPDGVVVDVATGPDWEHLAFQFGPANRNSESMNADVDFRRAVAHSIDRDALVETLFDGQVDRLDSFLGAHDPALATPGWDRYGYDPEEAERLLSAACTRAGRDCAAAPPVVVFSSTSDSSTRGLLDEFLEGSLEAIGIAYESDLERPERFFGDTLYGGTWDVGSWAWLGAPGVPGAVAALEVWNVETPCAEGGNCARWGTDDSLVVGTAPQQLSELIGRANATVDEAVAATVLAEAEALLADNVVVVPLYPNPALAAWWGDEVAGLENQATGDGLTWNVEDWYRRVE